MIYIVVIAFLILFSIIFDFRKGTERIYNEEKISNILYYIVLVIFILIAGLRWKVGGDSLSYQEVFEYQIPTLNGLPDFGIWNQRWEPLFILLMSLCKSIVPEFYFFQFVHAIFINVTIFLFIKKYTPLKFIAVLLYGYFFYWYFNMEILRQAISVCIFLWMYNYYKESKWGKYYLLMIIASLFHISSIILLILPFFKNKNLNLKGIGIMLIIGVILLPLSLYILNLTSGFWSFESLEYRVGVYSSIISNINNYIGIFLVFVVLGYIVYHTSMKLFGKIDFSDIIFNYFLLAIIYVFIPGFGRLLNFFIPFILIVLINIVFRIFKSANIKYVPYFLLVLILVFFPLYRRTSYYLKSTSEFYPNTRKINLWYPYSSIFTEEEYPYRKMIHSGSVEFDDSGLN